MPLVGDVADADWSEAHGALDAASACRFALARGIVDVFVTDALNESRRRLTVADVISVAAVRAHAAPLVGLSPAMVEAETSIKDFLFARMYRHARLVGVRRQAHVLITRLAEGLLASPDRLPVSWVARASGTGDGAGMARTVADYVSGLTDRQAVREHGRLFDAPMDFV